MSKMNKSLIKCKKEPNDIIYTPSELVKDCLKLVPIVPTDILLDPFLGDGAFYNQYPKDNVKDWCEIQKDRDFFKYNKKVDWIVSNPPFSKLNDVLDHCCLITNKGFGLIMLCYALTLPRINRMREKGYKITNLMWFNVKNWFGFLCVFVVFSKEGDDFFKVQPKLY